MSDFNLVSPIVTRWRDEAREDPAAFWGKAASTSFVAVIPSGSMPISGSATALTPRACNCSMKSLPCAEGRVTITFIAIFLVSMLIGTILGVGGAAVGALTTPTR